MKEIQIKNLKFFLTKKTMMIVRYIALYIASVDLVCYDEYIFFLLNLNLERKRWWNLSRKND